MRSFLKCILTLTAGFAVLCLFFDVHAAQDTVAPGSATDENYWQVVCVYSNGTVHLRKIEKIRDMRKAVRSPALFGAVTRRPYDLTWHGHTDEVLHSSRVEIPVGVRVPIGEGVQSPGVIPDRGVFLLRVKGPDSALDAVGDLSLSAPEGVAAQQGSDWPLSARIDLTVGEAELAVGVDGEAAPAPDGPIVCTKIRDTGDDDNRLVMVVVGDGYTSDDLSGGVFAADVDTVLAGFDEKSPWDVLLRAANVYRIDVASSERGADYEDGPPPSGTLKDTYFNSAFWTSGIERLLAPDWEGTMRAIEAADTYVGAGVWDQIIVVVNSSKYGGAGGTLATCSMHASSSEIAIHEVGHSFAHVADEYDYGDGATYVGPDPGRPNVDVNGLSPKWSAWIDPGTPLPTPDSATYGSTVGAFEGAYYNQYGIYRPWRECLMRYLNRELCPVCKEAHMLSFFELVSLSDSVQPSVSQNAQLTGTTNFTVETVPVEGVTVAWMVNGEPVSGATNETFTLTPLDLACATGQLAAVLSYNSSLVRQDLASETNTWTVVNDATTDRGVPYWWFLQYGLDPEADGDDYDEGDHMPAWKEYLAGTDPTNSASVLAIVDISGLNPTQTVVQWHSAADRTYSIHYAADLAGGFTNVAASGIPGFPPLNTHTVTVDSVGTVFYRVVVEE